MRLFPLILTLIAFTGCTTLPKQPDVLEASMTPKAVQPGESAVIRVAFQDQFNVIVSVIGIIPDDPSVEFELQDEGFDPDEKAGDDVWSLQVDAPFNAPPGDYEMEVTAYNSLEEPVLVQNGFREVSPLSVTIPLTILPNDE